MPKKRDELIRELADSSSDAAQFRYLLEKLTEVYVEKFSEIKHGETIPLSIFTPKLSPLETIVKFLKENKNLTFKEIGDKLNRDPKTVWYAYKSSKRKFPANFTSIESKYSIPVIILSNRNYSILEAIVTYLKDNQNLTYHSIATLLKRNDRTIWTVYNRAKNK